MHEIVKKFQNNILIKLMGNFDFQYGQDQFIYCATKYVIISNYGNLYSEQKTGRFATSNRINILNNLLNIIISELSTIHNTRKNMLFHTKYNNLNFIWPYQPSSYQVHQYKSNLRYIENGIFCSCFGLANSVTYLLMIYFAEQVSVIGLIGWRQKCIK